MVTLTREAWRKFASKCPAAWTEALFGNLDFIAQHGILESELRWCHFAATIGWEANGFKELRENLNYTTLGALRKAWPSRFNPMSDAQARTYLRNPKRLANFAYNGRMGNRVGSNDGYDYRGGGWIQTTGREAVAKYCKMLGVEPTAETLDDPVLTLKFAVLEWEQSKCNQWADENDIRKVAKAINTGSADSNIQPNGMSGRIEAFAKAWKLWGEYGTADIPAKKSASKKVTTVIATTAATAVSLIGQTVSTASDAVSSDPIGTAEKAVSTGQRVQAVAEQSGGLVHWIGGIASLEAMALGGLALAGGSLFWVLCVYLPRRLA